MISRPFLQALDERVLVCDGAMGTMLHAAGSALDRALPEVSLSDPKLVAATFGMDPQATLICLADHIDETLKSQWETSRS